MNSDQVAGLVRHSLGVAGTALTAAAIFDPALGGVGAAVAEIAGPSAIIVAYVWSFIAKR